MTTSNTSSKVCNSGSVVVPLLTGSEKVSRADLISENHRLKRLLETKSNSVESLAINNRAAYGRAKQLEESYLRLNEELSEARSKLDLSAAVGRELNRKVDEYRACNEMLELKVSLRDAEILKFKAKVESLCHLSCENIELREHLDDLSIRLESAEVENAELIIDRDLESSEISVQGMDYWRDNDERKGGGFALKVTAGFDVFRSLITRMFGGVLSTRLKSRVFQTMARISNYQHQRRLEQNTLRRKKMWEKGRVENPGKHVRSFPDSTFLR